MVAIRRWPSAAHPLRRRDSAHGVRNAVAPCALREQDEFVISDDEDSDDDPDYEDPSPLSDEEEAELDLYLDEVVPDDLGAEGADGTARAVQIVRSFYSPMDITEWEPKLAVDEHALLSLEDKQALPSPLLSRPLPASPLSSLLSPHLPSPLFPSLATAVARVPLPVCTRSPLALAPGAHHQADRALVHATRQSSD